MFRHIFLGALILCKSLVLGIHCAHLFMPPARTDWAEFFQTTPRLINDGFWNHDRLENYQTLEQICGKIQIWDYRRFNTPLGRYYAFYCLENCSNDVTDPAYHSNSQLKLAAQHGCMAVSWSAYIRPLPILEERIVCDDRQNRFWDFELEMDYTRSYWRPSQYIGPTEFCAAILPHGERSQAGQVTSQICRCDEDGRKVHCEWRVPLGDELVWRADPVADHFASLCEESCRCRRDWMKLSEDAIGMDPTEPPIAAETVAPRRRPRKRKQRGSSDEAEDTPGSSGESTKTPDSVSTEVL